MPNLTKEKTKTAQIPLLAGAWFGCLNLQLQKMGALEIETEAPDLEPHCSHSSELCIAIVITEGLR